MRVPIDDDVHVVRDGGIDHGLHTRDIAVRVLKVSTAVIDTHGRADQVGFPVRLQPANDAAVVEPFSTPAGVAPEQAVACEAGRLAAGTNLVATDRQWC